MAKTETLRVPKYAVFGGACDLGRVREMPHGESVGGWLPRRRAESFAAWLNAACGHQVVELDTRRHLDRIDVPSKTEVPNWVTAAVV